MSDILKSFCDLLLLPLNFLPPDILMFFDFLTITFSIFVVGRLFRWVWDSLPLA